MHDRDKKVVAGVQERRTERELPMPAYRYQTVEVKPRAGVVGQSSERHQVSDQKIKSLQNIALAR